MCRNIANLIRRPPIALSAAARATRVALFGSCMMQTVGDDFHEWPAVADDVEIVMGILMIHHTFPRNAHSLTTSNVIAFASPRSHSEPPSPHGDVQPAGAQLPGRHAQLSEAPRDEPYQLGRDMPHSLFPGESRVAVGEFPLNGPQITDRNAGCENWGTARLLRIFREHTCFVFNGNWRRYVCPNGCRGEVTILRSIGRRLNLQTEASDLVHDRYSMTRRDDAEHSCRVHRLHSLNGDNQSPRKLSPFPLDSPRRNV